MAWITISEGTKVKLAHPYGFGYQLGEMVLKESVVVSSDLSFEKDDEIWFRAVDSKSKTPQEFHGWDFIRLPKELWEQMRTSSGVGALGEE